MDHAGAVAGPLVASAYLYFHAEAYRSLFAWTLVPGVIVILILLRVPEQRREGRLAAEADRGSPGRVTRRFYLAVAVILIFSLANASYAFLRLRLGDLGVASLWIPLLWSALHVVKMTSSVIGGALSDGVGRSTMIALGLLWYAGIYAAGGEFSQVAISCLIRIPYGLYFGLTSGGSKARV